MNGTMEEQHLARLRDELARRAERAATLDLAYTVVGSPVGDLLLAATPVGIARVAFAVQDHDSVLNELAERISPRILRSPARLAAAARQLDEYFAGGRRSFDLAIDLRLVGGFRRGVIERLNEIEYGTVISYGGLATAAGRPRAVRAVGSACRANPVPLVLPCHRVIRADGHTGEYAGGADTKRQLLTWEDAQESQSPRYMLARSSASRKGEP